MRQRAHHEPRIIMSPSRCRCATGAIVQKAEATKEHSSTGSVMLQAVEAYARTADSLPCHESRFVEPTVGAAAARHCARIVARSVPKSDPQTHESLQRRHTRPMNKATGIETRNQTART